MRVLVETAVRVKGRDPSGHSGRYTKMRGKRSCGLGSP
jgi:hypothetical protein